MQKLTKLLFAFVMIFMVSQSAQASHWIAGNFELQYDSASGQYRVRIYWFNDCGGISAPTSVSVNLTSNSGCGNQNITLSQIQADVDQGIVPGSDNTPPEGYFYSNLCDQYQVCSECYENYNGGLPSSCNSASIPIVPIPGVELFIYEAYVTLPQCSNWQVDYTSCCRNGLPTGYSTNGGDNDSWYIYGIFSTVNNNSAPEFINKTVDPFICDNAEYEYDFGCSDPDGDSLVYSLVTPLQTSLTTPIAYNTGYGPTNFILTEPGTGGIYFEDSTGLMRFTPQLGQQQQVYFSVRVDEYRNGVYLGSIVKDIQLNTISNCEPLDAFVAGDGIIELTGGQYITSQDTATTDSTQGTISNTTIYVCAGDTLDFSVVIADTINIDADFAIETDFVDSLPNATFDTTVVSDSTGKFVVGHFNYIAQNEDVDTSGFTFTVQAKNNACPIKRVDVFNFFLEVKANTYVEPEEAIFCPTSDTVALTVTGGNDFTWRYETTDPRDSGANPAIDCDTCTDVNVWPPYTRYYIVKSDLGKFGCQDEDTAYVQAIQYPEILGDTCIDIDGEITLTAFWEWADDSTSGKIEYEWQKDEDLDEDELIVSQLDSVYLKVADITNNCVMYDTLVLDEQCPFIIPNVITPNGDGVNDYFVIKGKGQDEWNFTLYNRWGRLVYESKNYKDVFDAEGLPDGVYLYEINKQVDGEITSYKGWLQIMR